ncbi:MAG: hypothetical protein QOJ98_176 [Acidobacteriota bacterium]|nr:hypothetical protein [Acidobacteriota bacterium]
MNKALAIAARELRGRRSIFLTAAVLALIPYAVLLLPEVQRYGRSSAVAMTGAFVAVCYVSGLALVLGATFVGRELMEKRMSFFFSKPVSERALWFGKLAGALAALAIATTIIVVPVLLGSGDETPRLFRWLGYFALAALTLFLVSHAVATMLRSRSALIFLDVVACAVAAGLAYVMLTVLTNGLAAKLVDILLWSLTIGSLAILVAAGAWQLSRGRIDLRANHRELSRFLWSATAVMLALAGAAVLWVVSAAPDDLTEHLSAEQVPGSDWVVVSGKANHRGDYNAAFFRNGATGEYQRIKAIDMWWDGYFLRDGSGGGHVRKTRELDLLAFGPEEVKVTPTRVTVPPHARLVASDDGQRVAILTLESMVTIEAVPGGRTLVSARVPVSPPALFSARAFFVTPDLLRIYVSEPQAEIYELDVRTKKLARTGTISTGGKLWFEANAEGTRLLARSATPSGVELLLLDARTGARLGALGPYRKGEFGVLLSDGRIARFNVRHPDTLFIHGADLALQRQVDLGEMRYVWLLSELAGGRLLVAGAGAEPQARQPRDWSIRIIDVNSGAVVRHERAMRPMQMDVFSVRTDPRRRAPARAGTPLIVLDQDDKLKRLAL